MRLFIAEKPSLARAVADVLPQPHKRAAAHIACGDSDVVAWCAGHILQTAPPESYGPEYKAWRLEDLPIVPKEWKLVVSTPDLLKSIQALLKKAARVVHVGDPDREGQLLVDEVLAFLGYKGPVDRLLVTDLSPDAVARQLRALEPNAKFRPLSESALARQRADWLFGMNMTRLYTLLGRAAGYDGVLSVGRVQTPLLGLIVARDRAIESFTPAAYYVVSAEMRSEGGASFRATWSPGTDAEPHLDEERRLLDKATAEAVRQRAQGHVGSVAASTEDQKTEPPPLPYSLADLQMDAGRRLGLSAQAVLDACQALYETHRLTTYPRSDCSHLPEAHHAQAARVLQAIRANVPGLAPSVAKADASLRSKAWNDKKVTAHHAIIPTPTAAPDPAALQGAERSVYELIAHRYLAQFYGPHEYLQTKLELAVAGERFVATGRQIVAPGWKALPGDAEDEDDDKPAAAEHESRAPLPRLATGAAVTTIDVVVADKRTQPPKPFTDGSLISAMCAVAKFVTNPSIKKILTEADGIGTPATRASIIETLFERGYVRRDKKIIVSTPTGRALIHSLPEIATTPDMTAVWEAAMRAITESSQSLDAFLARVTAQLQQLVDHGRALGHITVGEARSCSNPGCTGTMRRLQGPRGPFLSCRICRTTAEDEASLSKSQATSKPGRSTDRTAGGGKKKTSSAKPRPRA
jgi:DNA topoisomerase-3